MITLERFALLPLSQDDELFVSLDPVAETEWIGLANARRRSGLDVPDRGLGPVARSRNLFF